MNCCDAQLDRDIIAIECNNISVKGAEREGLIFNRSDLDLEEMTTGGNEYVVQTLPLKTGKKPFKIVQPTRTPFNGTKTEAVVGTYATTYTHTLQIVVLNHGDYVAGFIDKLASGEFVAAIKNRSVNNDAGTAPAPSAHHYPWQLYGIEGGLHLASAVRELYNDDTLAGWLVTLTETDAQKSGIFATNDLIESYLNPTPSTGG